VHKDSQGGVLASFSYSYNADGLRTQVVEADGSTVTYTYDGAHRLVGEIRTGTAPYSISYTLDAEGNRLSQTVNGVTTTFSYNADDQLLSTSGGFNNSYTYNANGEQVSRVLNGVSYTLSWDYDGQLVGISGNGSTVTFGYDALGRRVSRTVNGTTCQLVHDGDRIIVERQGGVVTAVYSYGNALVARNGEVVLPDGLGTTRATVDGVQAITSTLTTEAFGNTVAQWGSTGNPYRFAGAWGYHDDGDPGLLHVEARYDDLHVGRFISRDAVLSEHPYLYCEHEPVMRVDPSGRVGILVLLAAVALVVILPGCGHVSNPPKLPPIDPRADTDRDRIPDSADPDDDNDGIPDNTDPFPTRPGAGHNPAIQPRSAMPVQDTALSPMV
jgi:RHS repeat-associated protein